jgi:hypothetical protein
MTPAILYALVLMQGGQFSIAQRYTTKAECMQMHKGGRGGCIAYAPHGATMVVSPEVGRTQYITRFPNTLVRGRIQILHSVELLRGHLITGLRAPGSELT